MKSKDCASFMYLNIFLKYKLDMYQFGRDSSLCSHLPSLNGTSTMYGHTLTQHLSSGMDHIE